MSENRWTPEQKQCIYCHGGTLLVSAAAGSGKTSVLVQRIIERITDPVSPIDVDRLLVVTFTRAAATEMKSRLAKALAECLSENPNDVNLQRQQLLLPCATIGTVDSFCGDLVRQNFHMLDIPPQFRVAEEQQLALIKREALNETVTEFYAAGDSAFEELTSMLRDSKNDVLLMSLIEKIEGFLQSHLDPEAWLDKMEAVYDDASSVRDTTWGRYVIDHIAAALKKAEQLCRVAVTLTESDPALTDKYLPVMAEDLSFITHAREVCDMGTWDELRNCLSAYTPSALWGTKKADKALQTRAKSLRSEVKKTLLRLPPLLCGSEAECLRDIRETRRMIEVLYAMVRRFSALFMEKKIAQRLFGFSDIAHLALRLLTERGVDGKPTPTALARELSERYDEILIDEYQDTNELQDALFSALSRQESNMFFVGDVKQSIYGFRQAMPKLFLDRRNRYPLFDGHHYPGTVVLGNNFRNRREVTAAVNFVFRQLMTREIGGLSYDENEALVFSAQYDESEGYEPELLLVGTHTPTGDKLSANEAEAEVIAARIKEMTGTLPVSDNSGGRRPLRYGDCCILVRSRTANSTYREVFERHGIPVATDDPGEFFDTAEIRSALSLLRCIDNPLLDVPLTAWLLSPLCGFSPDDLAAIRRCRPRAALYNALTAARTAVKEPTLQARCREAVAFLERYRTLACQLTVDKLLRRLYEETALPELMSARTDGERRRANLQLLQDTCAQFDQRGFRGLSSFIRYIDRLQAQGIALPGAAKTNTGDAVRIYTIHGSKGLEFPVVFLAGLHHAFNNKRSQETLQLHPELGAGIKRRDPVTFRKHVTLPHQVLDIALGNTEREEELRLLYVAMTRAREKLCLTMALDNPMKKLTELAATLDGEPTVSPFTVRDAKSMGEWLLTALLRHPSAEKWRQLIDREDLPLLIDDTPWSLRLSTPSPPRKTVCEQEKPVPAYPAQIAAIRERIAYRYPHEALSRIPTKLAASETVHGTLNRQFIATAQPAFLQSVGLSPTERGTAMHTFMQYAVYAQAADDTEQEIARLWQAGFLTEAQAASLDRRKLAVFFASDLYKRMCRSPRCLREYPFTALQPASQLDSALDSEEHLVIQGIADCLFEEDGALVIVDYKTDRVSEDRELIERYKTQLDIYRHALSKALAMPVRECLLYSFALERTVVVPMEDIR